MIVPFDFGTICGWVEIQEGDPLRIVSAGTVRHDNLGEFLDKMFPQGLLKAGKPENLHIAFEQPPRGQTFAKKRKDERAAMANWQRLSEQCVALLVDACRRYKVTVKHDKGFMPNTVKKAVTGNGRASKQQVRDMVDLLFEGISLSPDPGDHKHDAAAVGYCLLNRMHLG